MKKLSYEISIDGSKEAVWAALIDPDKFKIWTTPFHPKSYFRGEWKQDAEIEFVADGMGGTLARIDEFLPCERIVATHIATLTKDLVRETEGEATKKWIGTKESYLLSEKNGKTQLQVEMLTDPYYLEMFESSWPEALKKIKQVVEV